MVLDDNLDVRSLANENETFYGLKSRIWWNTSGCARKYS